MIQAPATERGERSRQAIIDAATPMFAERGFVGASLNEIIRASGLTKGGFYFHFPSKLALAVAVVREQQARWNAAVHDAASGPGRTIDRIWAVPRAILALELQGRGISALQKLVDELSKDPSLRAEMCDVLTESIRMTRDMFRRAQAEGDVRPDADPDVLGEVAVGGLIGMQTMTEQLGDGDLARRVEALIAAMQLAARPPGR